MDAFEVAPETAGERRDAALGLAMEMAQHLEALGRHDGGERLPRREGDVIRADDLAPAGALDRIEDPPLTVREAAADMDVEPRRHIGAPLDSSHQPLRRNVECRGDPRQGLGRALPAAAFEVGEIALREAGRLREAGLSHAAPVAQRLEQP